MKTLISALILTLCWLSAFGQTSMPSGPVVDQEESLANIKWVNNLYEHGIRSEADSLFISAEVQNIMANEELRNFLFPSEYTWESAILLLDRMQLKKAFWFLINLYPDNKEVVMNTILAYDGLFQMDKVLISTFYTYSMIDPAVCTFSNGQTRIKRPDIAEMKLQHLSEMIAHIVQFRLSADQE